MSKENSQSVLGLENNTVRLNEYTPLWADLYREEEERILHLKQHLRHCHRHRTLRHDDVVLRTICFFAGREEFLNVEHRTLNVERRMDNGLEADVCRRSRISFIRR